jgi:medium-chain acyl-[acyl-carrier-protein] hydrolase
MFQSTANRWLIGGRTDNVAKLRLFAFHHAGGGASLFRQWHKILPPTIEIYAVQLPGRETRFTEPKLTYFQTAIEAIVNAIRPSLDHPFVFFGHSLGAMLAFETARQLQRLGAPVPLHLFLSGCSAPQVHDPKEENSKLSDADFIQSVNKFGGMPEEILQNAELMELFLPTLRADFSLLETYQYREEPALDCPITALGGLNDLEAPQVKLTAWNIHTTRAFRVGMFPGDHFYLNHARTMLLAEIVRELDYLLKE